MKGMIKRWIKEAMNGMERMPPPTTAADVVSMMSTSMATIYRIGNGFIVSMHSNSETRLGSQGTLVYAKDAEELAAQIVANEARFKLGIRGEGVVKPPNGIASTAMPSQYALKI